MNDHPKIEWSQKRGGEVILLQGQQVSSVHRIQGYTVSSNIPSYKPGTKTDHRSSQVFDTANNGVYGQMCTGHCSVEPVLA